MFAAIAEPTRLRIKAFGRGLVRRLSVIAVAVMVLWPSVAEACPVCAAGETQGAGSSVLLALFIGAPFVVFAVAALSIRRLLRDRDGGM